MRHKRRGRQRTRQSLRFDFFKLRKRVRNRRARQKKHNKKHNERGHDLYSVESHYENRRGRRPCGACRQLRFDYERRGYAKSRTK